MEGFDWFDLMKGLTEFHVSSTGLIGGTHKREELSLDQASEPLQPPINRGEI